MVRGRNTFAFSDVRHIIAKASLSVGFGSSLLEKGQARAKYSRGYIITNACVNESRS